MTAASFAAQLKAEAQKLGFALAGICPAVAPDGLARFREWIDAGYAGEMTYLADRATAYEDPNHVLVGVKSILMLGLSYRTQEPIAPSPGQGRVSRYAWGSADYHDVIHQRLKDLKNWYLAQRPAARVRGVVDTAPLLERELAERAGLGWVGKHTLLLNRQLGSWFFLAGLLTDEELDYDAPFAADHCGTCRACLDACPTQAFPQPYVLDATRCISYLTIEHRSGIPDELRTGIGTWVFGCDVCQDVCPWNRQAPRTSESAFEPDSELNPLGLAELFALDEAAFRLRFRHTPLWRAKRRGVLRNAAIVLGNAPAPAAIEPLIRGLNDPEDVVRAACAWALGRYPERTARAGLAARLPIETEPNVVTAIQAALAAV